MEEANGLDIACFELLGELHPAHKVLVGRTPRVGDEVIEAPPVLDVDEGVACKHMTGHA